MFENNIVKVEALDEQTTNAACVSAHGHSAKSDTSLPVIYRNNTLISNICNVRWSDKYGKGQNHQIINAKIVRTGSNPNYHTFNALSTYWAKNNIVRDCEFGPGTAYNDALWHWTSNASFYDVEWTLTISAPASSDVTIKDVTGQQVFAGKVDENGKLAIPLKQCRISPPAKYNMQVATAGCTETPHTPHTIELNSGGRATTLKVDMKQQRTAVYANGSLQLQAK
jgi:hypothetical protein